MSHPARVSLRSLASPVLLALMLALTAGAPAAQVPMTGDPMMTKGPARAPVTIVEFSDYQ